MGKNRQGSFVITLILLVLIGGSAFFALTKMANNQQALLEVQVENILVTEDISKNQQLLVSSERGYLLLKNISFLKDKNELNEKIDASIQELEKSMTNDTAQNLLAESKEMRHTYNELMTHSVSEINNGNIEQSMALMKEAAAYAREFEANMNAFLGIQKELLADTKASHDQFTSLMKFIVIGLTGIALVISLVARRSKG